MHYSGDVNRTISILTGTIADGAVLTPPTEASVAIGELSGIYIWTTGTMSTEPSGTIDLVLQGKTGDMPLYITTGTLALQLISTGTPIIITASEVADFGFSMLKVLSVKNDLGAIISDLEIYITGMDKN